MLALEETVCQVYVEGHESQYPWVCVCNHKALVAIRDAAYGKTEELLQAVTPIQNSINIFRADGGHRVCVGDWSAANLRTAREALPDAPFRDVKWTLKLP